MRNLFILFAFIFLSGCSTTQVLTPQQILEAQEREEKIIIDTSTKLCVGLKQDLDNNYYLTEEEQVFFKKVAWRPLLLKLNKYADNDSTKTLNFKHVYAIQKQKEVLNELSHTI